MSDYIFKTSNVSKLPCTYVYPGDYAGYPDRALCTPQLPRVLLPVLLTAGAVLLPGHDAELHPLPFHQQTELVQRDSQEESCVEESWKERGSIQFLT